MRDIRFYMQSAGCGLLMLMLAGCASSPEAPALQKPAAGISAQFPPSVYLSAVGEGDTRRAAENSAAAALARIFESKIRSSETLSETTTETRGGLDSFDQESELRRLIQIDSELDLLNVQFSDPVVDSNGRVTSTAYMPRAETATIYRSRIADKTEQVQKLQERASRSDDPLLHYAFLRAAVKAALENSVLISRLDVLDPAGRQSFVLPYDLQSLLSETAGAAHAVTFSVELGDASATAVREALTGMGFTESKDGLLVFFGSESFEEAELKRGLLVFVRGRYSVSARLGDRSTVLSLNGSLREGHINLTEAEERTKRSLQSELRNRVALETAAWLSRLASAE